MSSATEIEVKFAISSPDSMRTKLRSVGARTLSPRYMERNWRLDTPEGSLSRSGQVLRVRQGDTATLTYKARGEQRFSRQEIEFEIASPERAIALFKGLGYVVVLVYEKYRQVFQLDDVEIMLDEVPFGTFVEIEGPDQTALARAADQMALVWEAGLDLSYMEIFHELSEAAGFGSRQMTFSDFEGYELDTMSLLGLIDAQSGNKETD
jgi:adenylate cyclase class 2